MLTSPRGRLGRALYAVGLAYRSAPAAAWLLLILTLLGAVLPVGVAQLGKATVDAVVLHARTPALRLALIELVLFAVLLGAQRTGMLVRMLLGTRLALAVNTQILQKALTLELRHFQDPKFYDQLTRARREATSRPLALATELLTLAQSVLLLGGFIGLLLRFSVTSVLVLMLAALPAAAAEVSFARAAFRLRSQRATEMRRLSYLEYVLSSDEHAKEIITSGLGQTLLTRYRSLGEDVLLEDRSLSSRRTLWGTLLALLSTLAFYGCYLLLVGMAAAGQISLGDMTLYVVAFRQGQQAFLACLTSLGAMYEHDLYMSTLIDFFAIPTRPDTPLLPGLAATLEPERGVRFQGVGFRYPDQEDFALRDIDLFIPAGRSLALVGENGAGKSTFIKLLAGLYEPTEGRILIDGCDVRTLSKEALRQRIAVVFQDFNQYQFSAGENISFGAPAHIADAARLERAVERGGADFVPQLPAGLATQLGRYFDGGVELSGGQWQRVALSRAFMREEADILILDEPTAALDAAAEQQLFERFRELSAGRTVLLISHRFPTVRKADHIVVLLRSRIAEQGAHEELMAHGGTYATMFRTQASGYL